MVETAAHLADHVFPPLPVRQWVLAVPKRLRYFLRNDDDLQGAVLRIFLAEVERCLRDHSAGCGFAARSGAVAFIHRFGSSLSAHVHFHCCVIDGVFEPTAATGSEAGAAPGVVFHAAAGLDAQAIAAVQAQVRRRVLRTFVRRALIGKCDAEEMADWDHGGGFSVDAAVRIAGADRAGLERLLRYCARPPFALEHLQQRDAEHLVHHCPKPRPDGPRDLVLTPLELNRRPAGSPLGGQDRRPGATATDASPSLLRRAGTQCATAHGGDEMPRSGYGAGAWCRSLFGPPPA